MSWRVPFHSILAVVVAASTASDPAACAEGLPRDGMILWLDAGDLDADGDPANQPRDGAPVPLWRDLSGQHNQLSQNAAAHQPTFHANALGGRPVVRFHGKDLLKSAAFSGLASGDQEFHVLVLMRAPAESAHRSQRILDLNSRDAPTAAFGKRFGFWVGFQNNRGRVRLGIHHGDEGEGLTVAWNGKPNLIEAVYSSEQAFAIHVNGRRDQRAQFNGTHFLGFKKNLTLALGQHFDMESNVQTYYEGDLAEVVIYNRPLTATERYDVGTHLANKYGLETHFRPIPHFENDVLPILNLRCVGCHGDETREANLDLRTVSAMLRGGKAGPVIVRGHADRSEMIAMVEARKMPPDVAEALSPRQISILRDWVEAGAPASEQVAATVQLDTITDQQRRHWAWQELVRHDPPVVQQTDRVRNAIDHFLLAKLEPHGLMYSPEADRHTLARRATFDLIGLPPSPQEVEAFVNDHSADAFEQMIDRLLASPHFGERWGRHWLDVSGYVDMVGSDNDFAIIKPLAEKWRYRDYVIRSLNGDKPFDQFLVEQLAGDELYDWKSASTFSPEVVEALTATGFLLCANDDTDQNELNTPETRHHVLQRTTEVVAANLLAMTVQCARCHDHKYEAFSQADYYRLESVFAPAFNVRHWIVATGHGRADVSDVQKSETDRHNAQLDGQIQARETRADQIRARYREALFVAKLDKIPEGIRQTLRSAFKTPGDRRTQEQKKLVDTHQAALGINPQELAAAISDADRAQLVDIAAEIDVLQNQRRSYNTIQVVHERHEPAPTYVLRRGNYLRPGLQVMPDLPTILRTTPLAVAPVRSSSGRRLAFARAVTRSETLAGQHVARVIVNRLWQQLFGMGLVESSDNFGVSGSPPSHPALLDHLTARFIDNGWRVKPIIKQMMISAAYRQRSSVGTDSELAQQVDPANRLVWRMNLRQLDSEYVRDAMLAASGRLDRTVFGPFVPLTARPDGMVVVKEEGLPAPTTQWRRSVYILARRNYHLTMLRVFGQPIVARNCTVRKPAAIVAQSLALLHDDFVLRQSEYFAERTMEEAAGNVESQVSTAFHLALGRPPSDDERTLAIGLVQRQIERFRQNLSEAEANRMGLAQLCQMLFNLNEFLYVE